MKIRAKVADLRAAAVAAAVAANTTAKLGVTSCLRFRADADGCTLEATDYETEAIVPVRNCEVLERGTALSQARPTLHVLAQLDDSATVEVTGFQRPGTTVHVVQIAVGRGRTDLIGLQPEEWPAAQADEAWETVDLPAQEFYDLVASVAYARSRRDPSRPALMGVQVALQLPDGQGHQTIMVNATDGRRLARNVATFESDRALGAAFVLPGDFARRVLPRIGAAKSLTLGIARRAGEVERVRFTLDGAMLATKVVRESFPDFSGVLSRESPAATVECKREDLLAALEALAALMGNTVPLGLRVVDGGIRAYASRDGECEGELQLDGKVTVHVPSELGPVGVPLQQLRDAVKRCGDLVELKIPDRAGAGPQVGTADNAGHVQLIAKARLDKPLPEDRQTPPDEGEDEAAAG